MRKEKYIEERKTKNGITFRVSIPYNKTYIKKSFNSKNYIKPSLALEEAKIYRDDILRKIRLNEIKSYPTVASLFQDVLKVLVDTIGNEEKYKSIYNIGIKGKLDMLTIDLITPYMLQENINEYALEHSQDAINRYITLWRKIYKVSNMQGYEISDKTQVIKVPKSKLVKTDKSQVLNIDDFNKVLEHLKNYPSFSEKSRYNALVIHNALIVMFYTGLRPSEVYALHSNDITSHISVNKAVGSSKKDKVGLISTKTLKSVRSVPISSTLKAFLDTLNKDGFLFLDYDGNFFDSDYTTTFLNLINKKLGTHFRQYQLRHNFATQLVKEYDLRTIQDLMGHTTSSTTLSYARSDEDTREQAVEKMGYFGKFL